MRKQNLVIIVGILVLATVAVSNAQESLRMLEHSKYKYGGEPIEVIAREISGKAFLNDTEVMGGLTG